MLSAFVILAATLGADAAAVQLRTGFLRASTFTNGSAVGPHGNTNCPCVGIDEVEGETMVTLKGGKKASYPADLGARCGAWDSSRHPKCSGGKKETWCEEKWCYVDPCNCKDISPYPKPSAYMPNSQYQGKPVHFSYATCDGVDSWGEAGAGDDIKKIEETCAVSVDSAKWGQDDCRCVGIHPQEGKLKVDIKGKKVDFPADTGAACHAWEADNHPDCMGASPPSWCSQAWCYVDPCSCKLATPPKTSSYVPEANFQGRPVYYSYATCGAKDSFTSKEHQTACVNQKNKDDCGKLSKCLWDGKNCLGKELVEACS